MPDPDVRLSDIDLDPRHLAAIPLIGGVIDRLGIRDVLDERLPRDQRSRVSDAECVTVMIANILQGRVALYDMGEWLSGVDSEALLGRPCPSDAFTDDRLGDALDHIFRGGTDSIFGAVAARFVRSLSPEASYLVPTDTTTLSLQGAYDVDYREEVYRVYAPVPARGHSKDFRPDLKQLVYGMSLHGPTGMPLAATMLDGNVSDAFANRVQLDKLAELLPAAHDVTLVGDCKLVDKTTLGWARRSGFEYVSLLPRTFALRSELVDEVRRASPKMEWLGESPQRLASDPPKPYRGWAFERAIRIRNDVSGEDEDVMHEVIVVHSTSLEEEFDRSLDDRLAKEKARIEKSARALGRRPFACSADAIAAARVLAEEASFSTVRTTAALVTKPAKRQQRGRPPATAVPTFTEHWQAVLEGVERDEERIAIARVHASHFTLLSSRVGEKAWGAKRVFEAYRAQQTIEGHTGFRWLKGAANVAPLFLKLPHRIAALGLVFLLALMVRNYIEGTVRAALRERQKTLPDMNDKPTMKPTTEAIFRLFRFAQVIRVTVGERLVARQVHHLPTQLSDILDYLNLPADLFHRTTTEIRGGFG